MRLNLLKKLGILGAAVAMMTTTVVANDWSIGMTQSSYVSSSSTGTKTTRNNYAVVKRTDNVSLWTRTQFLTYVVDKDNKNNKTEIGAVVYPSSTATVYYTNYANSYVGKEYYTYAQLSPTSYYSTYTITGTTTP